MPHLRDSRILDLLDEYNISADEAFHVLIKALTESHLRTLRENVRTCQPNPTIMLAVG